MNMLVTRYRWFTGYNRFDNTKLKGMIFYMGETNVLTYCNVLF